MGTPADCESDSHWMGSAWVRSVDDIPGNFVIDTPFSTQGEIVEAPSEHGAKRIGLRLGIISNLESDRSA